MSCQSAGASRCSVPLPQTNRVGRGSRRSRTGSRAAGTAPRCIVAPSSTATVTVAGGGGDPAGPADHGRSGSAADIANSPCATSTSSHPASVGDSTSGGEAVGSSLSQAQSTRRRTRRRRRSSGAARGATSPRDTRASAAESLAQVDPSRPSRTGSDTREVTGSVGQRAAPDHGVGVQLGQVDQDGPAVIGGPGHLAGAGGRPRRGGLEAHGHAGTARLVQRRPGDLGEPLLHLCRG